MIRIKKLSVKDYLGYKKIRLEMLDRYPFYFGSSMDEEILFSDNIWMNRLNKKNAINFGLMDDDKIIGLVVLMLNLRKK